MKKLKLLPLMAMKGIVHNGSVYYPYFAACIFSVFTYFVFSSILLNDIIATLPRSVYAWIMLEIGRGLLAIILFLFLVYANSFLVKRRQKEFGLYHILGLEKKHIGSMMFFETVLTYLITLAGGIVLGLVLAKLLFLILLRMSGMTADVEFVFSPKAFEQTLGFFFWVFVVNFVNDLWRVGKARPVELMSGSKKGEKEPRFLLFYALVGILTLGIGYRISIKSELNSEIFTDFFLAVFLVIIGTYLLFTSGSIVLLKMLKKRKKIYYKPKNFITISGMLYRMKKSAASLSNLCIFSTMVIITLVCTVSLYLGMDNILHFGFPYDVTIHYRDDRVTREEVLKELEILEDKYGNSVNRMDIYEELGLSSHKEGNRFVLQEGRRDYQEDFNVKFLTLDDYNQVAGREISLKEDEVLVYCSGRDFGYANIDFFGRELKVAEEISEFFPAPKAKEDNFGAEYFIVVRDRNMRDYCAEAWAKINGVEDMEAFLNSETQYVRILLDGADSEKEEFLAELSEWCQSRSGFTKIESGVEGREQTVSMYGGLLFIGVLFGLIFFMCLILIMYYKQISEGYEDRNNFEIMQKVGMSDKEIKGTVSRQILLVFALPLVGAGGHTVAGMFMVEGLMGVLSLFDHRLLVCCALGVTALFAAVYGISYFVTARTYYKIVR